MWLNFLLIYLLLYVLYGAALYGTFRKAGEEGWKAFVPVLYELTLLKIIDKPWWWAIIQFIPGIGLLVSFIVLVELAKCYGKFKLGEQALAVLPGISILYFAYLSYSDKEKFLGPDYARANFHRSKTREWVDAIIFAIVAATIIRSFFIEAYTIPSQSMEETLLVNDFLFVSKLNYGPRVPMTPISFPLAHNTMPFFNTRSYMEWPSIPYYRLPGWEKIENGDIVVFNFPGDLSQPVDKRDNYIKRCIAIPGDTLTLKGQETYINGKLLPFPVTGQKRYLVVTKGETFSGRELLPLGIIPGVQDDYDEQNISIDKGYYYTEMKLTEAQVAKLREMPIVKEVRPLVFPGNIIPEGRVLFPSYAALVWNEDNFGPLYIPRKGDKVPMTVDNYYIYRHAIAEHEGNKDFTIQGDQVFLDGKPIKEYEFKMDYYFMMGDNRYNSSDGRFWGLVPADHIVGKPVLIWFSYDRFGKGLNFIRWNRLFKAI